MIRSIWLIAFVGTSSMSGQVATPQAADPVTISGLGTLTFPVTTSSDSARHMFLEGTLLLHLFHYPQARAAFREAERIDPGFTMAYWGEALAWNYAVWNQEAPDSARAALAKLGPTSTARAAKARSQRERDYLAAVELLYGPGSKARRDTLWASAQERLSRAYPGDDEAKLFYALALLGLNQGVRDVATYERAFAIANDVFRRHPDNPGASHYVIHASDDPAHAARGLDAARALAKSSPSAEHAQHMTSHIFMALGMWDDVVAANERATHTTATAQDMPGMNRSCGHGITWLHYGYLAQGRASAARVLLERCQRDAATGGDRTPAESMDPDESAMFSAVSMWSRYLLDTEDWGGQQAQWSPALGKAAGPRRTYAFAKGYAAAKRGDLSVARNQSEALRAANLGATELAARMHDTSPERIEDQRRARVLDLELGAAILSAERKHDQAIELLKTATAVEDSMAYAFGPPEVDKPSHELFGEELLLAGRNAEARAQFERALETTPGRPLAVRGLASAVAAAGKRR